MSLNAQRHGINGAVNNQGLDIDVDESKAAANWYLLHSFWFLFLFFGCSDCKVLISKLANKGAGLHQHHIHVLQVQRTVPNKAPLKSDMCEDVISKKKMSCRTTNLWAKSDSRMNPFACARIAL